jgi:hypothetical protein
MIDEGRKAIQQPLLPMLKVAKFRLEHAIRTLDNIIVMINRVICISYK